MTMRRPRLASLTVVLSLSGTLAAQPAESGEAATPSVDDTAVDNTAVDDTAVDDTATGHATADDSDANAELDAEQNRRQRSLREGMNLDGSTGLLRSAAAGSGAAGTFRFGLLSSYFAKTGFLCPPCEPLTATEDSSIEDHARSLSAHILLSATPTEYLEAYLGIHSQATSNDRDRPELLQILGDTNLGVKGFIPWHEHQMWSAGGAAEILFLNGPGGVGVENASFALRALSSLDWSRREDPKRRLPLRGHFNFNYFFDNSGKLIESTEAGRSNPISRVERYGLGISRVDIAQLVFGVEGMFEIARPFLEWSIDVPSNRQDYVCNRATRRSGDTCMDDAGGFGSAPSRLTIGARSWLPWIPGLGAILGLDIGTGHTSDFVEEFTPEPPYNFFFGISYAADTVPPPIRTKTVEIERVVLSKREEFQLRGVVVDEKSGAPIENAIVHFLESEAKPSSLPAAVSNAEGVFLARVPAEAQFSLSVTAPGYHPGTCQATSQSVSAHVASSPATDKADATTATSGKCALKALPQVGNIEGSVLDATSLTPIEGVTILITDRLNRQLELGADARGAFRFENIIPGEVRLRASAPGYFPSVVQLPVAADKEHVTKLYLHPRPEESRIRIGPVAVVPLGRIAFAPNSALLVSASLGLIQELAETLIANPRLRINIKVHAVEGSITPELAAERATAIRDELVLQGVPAERLTTKTVVDGKTRKERIDFFVER